jgi:hypothetical protein
MCLGYFIFVVFSCDQWLCSNKAGYLIMGKWLLVLNPLRIFQVSHQQKNQTPGTIAG